MKSIARVEILIPSKSKDLGAGFIVRRSLPHLKKRTVGPFVFFDHMGPVDLAIGNGMDVRPHPHIGLSTLTYLFEGEIVHRDTLGVEQLISPGAVNWMTAGSGVAHSERSSTESRTRPQRLHGIQIWIALPKEKEEVKSEFFHHDKKSIPEVSNDGIITRVIVGRAHDQESPVKSFTEMTYVDLQMQAGKTFEFEKQGHELAVYCVSGRVNVDGTSVGEGDMAILTPNARLQMGADTQARVLVLGGQPLPEERFIWWNFVSSSKERIEKAKIDWRNQNFGKIRGETEFIPLPEN